MGLLSILHLQAQIEKVPILKLNGSQFSIRNTLSPGIDFNVPELRRLLPNSTILLNDFSSFNQISPSVSAYNIDLEYLMGFAIQDKNGKYCNNRFRVGFNLGFAEDFQGSMSETKEIRLDSTGNAQFSSITRDSFHFKLFSVYHTSNQFNINLSYILNSNPMEKINIFLGTGLSIGLLFNRKSNVSYNEGNSTLTTKKDSNGRFAPFESKQYPTIFENELFKEKALFLFMPYATLGFNYQISMKNTFWKKVFVGYEIRPSVRFLNHQFIGKHRLLHINHGLTINYKI